MPLPKKPATRKPAPMPPALTPARKKGGAALAKPARPAIPAAAPAATVTAATGKTDVAPAKVKKAKLVRDSFTIPKAEYAVLEQLKQRSGGLAATAKKSELLRAGVKALAAMSDGAFLEALRAVPAIKTGRPSAS